MSDIEERLRELTRYLDEKILALRRDVEDLKARHMTITRAAWSALIMVIAVAAWLITQFLGVLEKSINP